MVEIQLPSRFVARADFTSGAKPTDIEF